MLQVSLKQSTVNPTSPIWQAGGATRTDKAKGVYSDIKCMVLALKVNHEEMLLATLDATAIPNEDIEWLKKEIHKACGLAEDRIFIAATHTHSAPALRSNNPDQVDQTYKQWVFDTLIKTAKEAMTTREDATCSYQKGEVIGFYGNRDKKEKAGDQSVYILKFKNNQNQNIAALVNIHCHPTFLDQSMLMVSSDIAGALRKYLKEPFGVEPIFVCGVTGDMSSRYYRQGQDYFELERCGKGIADEILKFDDEQPLNLDSMEIKEVEYYIHREIDMNDYKTKLESYLKQKETETNPIELRLLATKIKGAETFIKANETTIHVDLKTSIINLGELQIVTFNNDPVVEFGKWIKQASKHKLSMTWNHLNGEVGYLVEKEDFNTGYIGNVTKALPGQAEEYIQKIIDEMN